MKHSIIPPRRPHRTVEITIESEYTDVLALDDASFLRHRDQTDEINERLFGRPLGGPHMDRSRACFMRSVFYRHHGALVGRANLTVLPLRVYDPARGREAPIYACVGGGGVLPEYDDVVRVHPFVLRAMRDFHAPRIGSRRHVYLLATNVSPLASFIAARHMPRVHPYPGRQAPGFELLRAQLVEKLFPAKLEGFRRRGLLEGPPPRVTADAIRGDNPLLASYVTMHGDYEGGDRLPMVVPLDKRDVLVALRRIVALRLGKQLGIHRPGRVEPPTLIELLLGTGRSLLAGLGLAQTSARASSTARISARSASPSSTASARSSARNAPSVVDARPSRSAFL